MKDLLSCVDVVVKTLNLKIWQTTSKNCTKVRAAVQHDYLSSLNQLDHCFLASSVPLLSSLLKLRINSRGVPV